MKHFLAPSFVLLEKMWCLVELAPWQKYDFGIDVVADKLTCIPGLC